jgi:protein-S-isoprenylcysteine O-methyltransferase Ste14
VNALRVVAVWLPIIVFFRQLFGASTTFSPVSGGRGSPLAILISLGFLGVLAGGPPATLSLSLVLAGSVGLVAALALFEWARHAIRGKYFSYIYADDTPTFLFTGGPYAYIRNPFYTSYLLSMSSTALMMPAVHRALIIVAAWIYFDCAARFEERKFARSLVAQEYEIYKRRTGRFIPRRLRPGRE